MDDHPVAVRLRSPDLDSRSRVLVEQGGVDRHSAEQAAKRLLAGPRDGPTMLLSADDRRNRSGSNPWLWPVIQLHKLDSLPKDRAKQGDSDRFTPAPVVRAFSAIVARARTR
jgi:hypothetical protein